MKDKIKKGYDVLKKEGVVPFAKKTAWFFAHYYRLAVRMVVFEFVLKNKNYAVRRLRHFSSRSSYETLSFIRHVFAGAFEPMQVQEEFLELLEIFKKANPKIVMEIGTANGGTLFCFSKLAPGDATIISIDLPKGKFGGGYPEWKVSLYQAFAKDGQDLHLLRENSHSSETLEKVKKILAGRQIDFLFIDGDHTYEGVKKDFEMYSPLVRKGGVVALHDVAAHPEKSGVFVRNFWLEVCGRCSNQSKEIIKNKNQGWAGMGVLFL